MATRSKGLRWASVIKRFHMFMTFRSKGKSFFRAISKVLKGFSKLNHQLCLCFFADKIWENKFNHWENFSLLKKPFVLGFPSWVLEAVPGINETSKFVLDPFDQILICIHNIDSGCPSIRAKPNMERPLSIYDACKVSQFSFSPHVESSVKCLVLD